MAASFHWQISLTAIRMNDDGEELDLETTIMLTDTGTSLTYLVDEDFDKVIAALCKDKLCELSEV